MRDQMFGFSILKNYLQRYNEKKFLMQPVNRMITWFPFVLSPLSGIISGMFFSFLLVTFFVATNAEYSTLTSTMRVNASFNALLSLFGFVFIFAYLWSYLIIYPISYLMKHHNGRKFLLINHVIVIAASIGLSLFIHSANPNAPLTSYFFPLIILIVGTFNTYSFKVFNELLKRDTDGRVVYFDGTTDKKPIIPENLAEMISTLGLLFKRNK